MRHGVWPAGPRTADAPARVVCLEFMTLRDGSSRQVVGEYTDELANVDDAWVFTHRHYQVLMTP
jgi:hypothetical protein